MQIQEKYRTAVNEFVMRAVERHKDKIESIILFGSVARGEAFGESGRKTKALFALRDIFPKTHAGVVSQFGLQFVTEGLIEELYAKSLAKAETKRERKGIRNRIGARRRRNMFRTLPSIEGGPFPR